MATIRSTLAEQAATIRTREDLVGFVHDLVNDLRVNPGEWENRTLETYLDALASWVEDCDGYYRNRDEAVPPETSWKAVAEVLMAARSYE